MQRAPDEPLISIVAPVYNEEGNVERFVAEVRSVMLGLSLPYELLLVDDGSADETWSLIRRSASDHPEVRGLSLSRNFGHQSALFAGLHHARGCAIITLDGDLQHPPALIPQLVQAWQSGFQVVTTHRTDSDDTGWLKRTTSRWFYRVFSYFTEVQLEPGSSDFRLIDAEVQRRLAEMRDADLFLRGLVAWLGFRATSIPYKADPRFSGTPKFGMRRMLRLSLGAMMSFSMLPLRLGIWLGFVTTLLSFVAIGYGTYHYFKGNTVPGWASVIVLMSLMFSVSFMLLGTIGIYLGKIFDILRGRQQFVVAERCGFERGHVKAPLAILR
jgi:dolichol-phosphate mannosyltransferase